MTVLLYHGFSAGPSPRRDDPHSLFVSVSRFRRQLEMITRRASGLSLDAWLAGAARGVLVTVDDGYRSVLERAVPVARDAGVPLTLFVPPAIIGRDAPPEPILTADELRAAVVEGVSLGVHGLDHTPMAGMTESELRRNTAEAREMLADVTGVAARAFSYPNGSFDERAERAVEAAGFDAAFSVDRTDGTQWSIPRVGIYGRDTIPVSALKLALAHRRLRPVLSVARRLRPAP